MNCFAKAQGEGIRTSGLGEGHEVRLAMDTIISERKLTKVQLIKMEEKKLSDEELTKAGEEALKKLKKLVADPKWEQFADTPCLMLKISAENRVISRGEAVVKMPIHELFDKLSRSDALKTINSLLSEYIILQKITSHGREIRVNYMRYLGQWPVEDRDMVNATIFEKGADECWVAS
jgi:hypothetical protein